MLETPPTLCASPLWQRSERRRAAWHLRHGRILAWRRAADAAGVAVRGRDGGRGEEMILYST